MVLAVPSVPHILLKPKF